MSQDFMDCQWQSMLANAKLETWPGRSREAPEARDVTKVGTPPPAPAPVLLRKNTMSRAGGLS
ncbi:MAG: hypothetical protein ACRETE_10800, partial [Stenotrophobium sp.]